MKRFLLLLFSTLSIQSMDKQIARINQEVITVDARLHGAETRVGILEDFTTEELAKEQTAREATTRQFAQHFVDQENKAKQDKNEIHQRLQALEAKNKKTMQELQTLYKHELAVNDHRHDKHVEALKALHDRTADHTNQLITLQNQQAQSNHEIALMRDRHAQHKQNVEALYEVTAGHTSQIATLQNRQATQGENIRTHQQQITALQTTVSQQQSWLRNLAIATGVTAAAGLVAVVCYTAAQPKNNATEEQVQEKMLQESQAALQKARTLAHTNKTMEALTIVTIDNYNKIADQRKQIDLMQNKVNAQQQQVDALKANSSNSEKSQLSSNAAPKDVVSRVNELQSKVNSQQQQIDSLAANQLILKDPGPKSSSVYFHNAKGDFLHAKASKSY